MTGLAKVLEFVGTVGVVLTGGALAGRGRISLTFYLVGLGMLLAFAATIAAVREPRVLPSAGPAATPTPASFRAQVVRLWQHRAASRLLICLFCYRFGSNAIQPYLTLFAIRVIGTDERIAQYLFVTLARGTGLLLALAELLAARQGRRPVLALGSAGTAVAALAGLAIRDVPQAIALAAVAGAANAAITATDWPLLSELVPPAEMGVFAGLKTACESVVIPASVVVSAALIDVRGYRMIFVVLAIGSLGALALLPSVRVPVPNHLQRASCA